jgi:hypothetical protein
MRVLKKIVFPRVADHVHPFEQVANFVVSLVAKGNQESVGAELDVVTHHGQVHSNEFDGEGINNEFHFDVDCAADDVGDACCRKAVDQFGVEEACKVAVESFVTADQFIAEAEARNESVLFEPEYGAERVREEMPLTVANAIIRLAKLALVELHHLRAQLASRWTHGTVSMAWSRCSFSFGSLMYMLMGREYVLLWMYSPAIWKP